MLVENLPKTPFGFTGLKNVPQKFDFDLTFQHRYLLISPFLLAKSKKNLYHKTVLHVL
ncbi:hypothetical protein D932_01930 [Enterococcus casseliflavus 14-MB-W-14]|nr:hypothetical protein D932_01930 [Enterococcus casseliflavus 14-MB-W-14]